MGRRRRGEKKRKKKGGGGWFRLLLAVGSISRWQYVPASWSSPLWDSVRPKCSYLGGRKCQIEEWTSHHCHQPVNRCGHERGGRVKRWRESWIKERRGRKTAYSKLWRQQGRWQQRRTSWLQGVSCQLLQPHSLNSVLLIWNISSECTAPTLAGLPEAGSCPTLLYSASRRALTAGFISSLIATAARRGPRWKGRGTGHRRCII